jgi:hypothetical protein
MSKVVVTGASLRPWYVLGPGNRSPYLLLPFYWLAETIPAAQDGAGRLGLVSLSQMTGALLWAAENPSRDVTVPDVPAIRNAAKLLV